MKVPIMRRISQTTSLVSSRLVIALSLALAAPLMAQTTDHSGHKMAGTATPATLAYEGAMTTMMSAMEIPYSGNPDADFVRGMIPHHQGAVDNARIVLQYGTDPDVRKFAEAVIAAQEAEILWLTEWLAKNGG